jgi:hypothetical protein
MARHEAGEDECPAVHNGQVNCGGSVRDDAGRGGGLPGLPPRSRSTIPCTSTSCGELDEGIRQLVWSNKSQGSLCGQYVSAIGDSTSRAISLD